ncbi:MAG: hypothetical protein NTY91_01730 [Euryarchaeota archaeon]|nr:hypothetical protein [Euryarchaeota archaeon]
MKKLTLGSIFIVGLLLLATSFVSVVGTKSSNSSEIKTVDSPLFTHRILQSINQQPQKLRPTYLGEGKNIFLRFSSKSTIDEYVDDAVQLVIHNPQLIDKIVVRMKNMPATQQMLKKYGLSQKDLEGYVTQIKNDPSLLRTEMEQAKAQIKSGKNPGQPLGLNTSNPFACVITIIALLPVIAALLVVVLIVATITIITCLNINNCLTNLTDQLTKIITQELLPP